MADKGQMKSSDELAFSVEIEDNHDDQPQNAQKSTAETKNRRFAQDLWTAAAGRTKGPAICNFCLEQPRITHQSEANVQQEQLKKTKSYKTFLTLQ